MNNFENGLPPDSVNISDYSISDVIVKASNTRVDDLQHVRAIIVNKSIGDDQIEDNKVSAIIIENELIIDNSIDINKFSAILLDKNEYSGRSTVMFL